MQIFLTFLYAVAVGLSVWGVVEPLVEARSFNVQAKRARPEERRLYQTMLAEQKDEAKQAGASARYDDALAQRFGNGRWTLGELSRTWGIRSGSTAQDALTDARSRAKGLAWVVAGIVVGSFASILSVWFLP